MKNKMIFTLALFVLFSPAWAWINDYTYQATITGAGNVTLTLLDTQTLISNSKMNSNCSDIRMTDTADNEYEFWVQYCNTTETRIYAKPTDSTEVNHFIYYGESGAVDNANFNATLSNPSIPNGDFEGDGAGDPDEWTIVEVDGSVDISTTRAFLGSQSVKYVDDNGGQPTMTRTFTGVPDDTLFEWAINIDFVTTTGAFVRIGGDTGSNAILGMFMKDNNDIDIYPSPGVQTLNISYVDDEWTNFTLLNNMTTLKTKFWVNNQYAGEFDFRKIGGDPTTMTDVAFQAGAGSITTYYIDAVRLFRFSSYTAVGPETPKAWFSYSYTPDEILINTEVAFVANWTTFGNITKMWWNFSTTNQTFYTTEINTNYAGFTTAESHNVTLIGFNVDSGTNITYSELITAYAPISGVVIGVANYLPFLFEVTTVSLNYTSTDGLPTKNSTWAITLPNSTVWNTYDQTQYSQGLPLQGTYSISLIVCDVNPYGGCAGNSTSFRAWNVTNGVAYASAFNETDKIIATVFENDQLTLASVDSIHWNLSSQNVVGTSATFTFGDSNSFYSDAHYNHYNISLLNTWGIYQSSKWVTAIAVKYNLTGTCAGDQNDYCFIYGKMYDEETMAQITGNITYNNYLLTSLSTGHSKEVGFITTADTLDIRFCMNATPLINSITLDGHIVYDADGYVSRMHAFDAATLPISASCSFVLGNQYKFFTTGNTTNTYSTTITVLQGGAALSGALVQVEYYFNDTGTGEGWGEVASQVTDSNGQVQLNLKLCPTWYKFKVSNDGSLLHEEKSCLKTISYTISVGSELPEFYTIYGGVSTACIFSNVTEYLSCSLSDSTGATIQSTLEVFNALSSTPICTTSEASSSTTLLCDMSGHPDGDYGFTLKFLTASWPSGYLVNSGSFTKGNKELFGTGDGPFIAIIIILIVLVGARMHPFLMVILSTLIIIALGIVRLISVPYQVISWLLAMAAVTVMVIMK